MIRIIDGVEFIPKNSAYLYAMKKEIEAIKDIQITDEEVVEFLDEYLSEISECLSDSWDTFKEN